MKLTAILPIVLLLTACKKDEKKDAPAKTESAAPKPAPDAAAAAVVAVAPIDAAPAAPAALSIPADAQVVSMSGDKPFDGTALGPDVTVQLIHRLKPMNPDGGYRDQDELLVLTGAGKNVVLDLGTRMWADVKGADGLLESAKPVDPPRPAAEVTTHDAPPPFKGPVIFLWERDLEVFLYKTAVAHDGDAIIVWVFELVDGEGGEWEERARVTLAAGAKVTAR